MEDQISIKEAAISSLQSMENLVLTLSTPSYSLSSSSSHQFDCKEITDQTVSNLKKFISVLDRTGRARFRRGPVQTPPVTSPPQTHTLDFTKPRSDSCGKVTGKSQLFYDAFSLSLGSSADGKITGKCQFSDDTFTTSPPISGNSSFLSSITADGSVTGGNLLNPTPGGKVTGKCQFLDDSFSISSPISGNASLRLSLGSSSDGKITGKCQFSDDTFTTSPSISGNSSFLSTITADGSVTGGNLLNPTPGCKVTGKCQFLDDSFSISSPISGNASLLSSITADGSVTGGKVAVSNGRLPLSSSKKKDDNSGNHTPSASRCHCSKKRKERQRRSIRVPATSSRIADIPPDEGLWRKYGRKPIKGSPHPSPYDSRSYYKCSSVRGCSARKHVERAFDDVSMLLITYEGEHRHVSPS